MKSRHSLKLLLLIGAVSLLAICWSNAWAQTDLASNYLYEYGLARYQNGYLDDAIHELRKSLIINPYNFAAKQSLEKLLVEQRRKAEAALDPDPAPVSKQDDPSPNRELQEDIVLRDRQINGLTQELQVQQNSFQDKLQELSALTDQLNRAKNKIAELEQAASSKDQALNQNLDSLANLKNEKDQLANQLTQASQATTEQAAQLKASQDKVKALEALTEQLTSAKNKIAELEQSAATKDQ
ncbi:MAG: hypothetical protein Q7K98_03400, partial [Candidatus Omnitrophota bacterium]|nr:hypothetical protein [Candidatus Omnitrophota bacterium]